MPADQRAGDAPAEPEGTLPSEIKVPGAQLAELEKRLSRVEEALCVCYQLENQVTEMWFFRCPIHPEKNIG